MEQSAFRARAALEPAATVIRLMGGFDAVAKITGRDPTRVHRWTYPRARGGTDGLIPADCQAKLMAHSRANDGPLRPEHFFPADDEAEAPPKRRAG